MRARAARCLVRHCGTSQGVVPHEGNESASHTQGRGPTFVSLSLAGSVTLLLLNNVQDRDVCCRIEALRRLSAVDLGTRIVWTVPVGMGGFVVSAYACGETVRNNAVDLEILTARGDLFQDAIQRFLCCSENEIDAVLDAHWLHQIIHSCGVKRVRNR